MRRRIRTFGAVAVATSVISYYGICTQNVRPLPASASTFAPTVTVPVFHK
jgi:hypothetical protein